MAEKGETCILLYLRVIIMHCVEYLLWPVYFDLSTSRCDKYQLKYPY